MNQQIGIMGLILALSAAEMTRCSHPAVDETVDGHACRICGELVDA